MWKREEADRAPEPPAGSTEGAASRGQTRPASPGSAPKSGPSAPSSDQGVVNIGRSVVIKGELSGSENLTIEGNVDGQIELRQHALTIGPHGSIQAQVFAKSVIVMGTVSGNISATEKINIRENGSVEGDIAAPTIAIAEGAHFRGSIDMQRPAHTSSEPRGTESGATVERPAPARVGR